MEPKHQNRVLRYAVTFLKWNFALKPDECSVNSFCGHKYKPKTVFLGMHYGRSCGTPVRGEARTLLCWSSPLLCAPLASSSVSFSFAPQRTRGQASPISPLFPLSILPWAISTICEASLKTFKSETFMIDSACGALD